MARIFEKGYKKPFWIISILPIFILLIILLVFVLYKFQVSPITSILIFLFVLVLSYFRMRKYFESIIFEKNMIYTPRAGWFYWREIKKAYIREVPGIIFTNKKCIFFDLYDDQYETPLYEHWRMYLIPTKEIVICESENDMPLEQMLEKIKRHLKS